MIAEEKYEDRLYYGILASELAKDCHRLAFGGSTDIILEKHNIKGHDITIVRDDLFPKSGGHKIT